MSNKTFQMMLGACLLQALTINLVSAEPKIKYGEWEVNITIEDLPIAVPLQSQHICLDRKYLVRNEHQLGQCKIKWRIREPIVNWTVNCRNGDAGKGQVVYTWDKFRGSSEMSMAGTQVSLHTSLTGKWKAASCSAESRSLLQSSQSR